MRRGGSVSGAVSLVMIFCVLCLAVFAVLTLATAVREKNLTDITAQRAEEYYAADEQAVAIVSALRNGQDPGTDVTRTDVDGAVMAEFRVPAGGDLALDVCVLLRGGDCQILRWNTIYEGVWEPETGINVWDGAF